MRLTDDQLKHMVERFLGWRLPENFNPDAGISFKNTFNENTPYPMKHEPTGTNLFDYGQAEEMVRYMVESMPGANGEPLGNCRTPHFLGEPTPNRKALIQTPHYELLNGLCKDWIAGPHGITLAVPNGKYECHWCGHEFAEEEVR